MSHESARSQGKGSRRRPGRPGRALKRKKSEWEKQAAHMVESREGLPQPVTTLSFPEIWGKSPSDAIYLFDQEMAKVTIPYFMDFKGGRRGYVFLIYVSENAAVTVQRIIDRLRHAAYRARPSSNTGWWNDIQPARLSKVHKDHPWVFAGYFGWDADGITRYKALIFRNKERTEFGIKEWFGSDKIVGREVLEKMAHRIVTDSAYRRQLISDDPDLVEMWKRR
jgi:hypothetical protein